jgi:hypothetical protein
MLKLAKNAIQANPNHAKARVCLAKCLSGIVCNDAKGAEREWHMIT